MLEDGHLPETDDKDLDPAPNNSSFRKTVRIIYGVITMLNGIALFCSSTVWFAHIDAGKLNSETSVSFALGILSGIFQLGSTQILFLLGIHKRWRIFTYFNGASFLCSVIVFFTSARVHSDPPKELEETIVKNVQPELLAVVAISGFNSAVIGIFLIIRLVEKIYRICKNEPLQYETME